MSKNLWILFCLLSSLLFISCATTMPGGGGVFPGFIMNQTVTPGDLANYDQRYAAYPDSFEILGEVEGTSSNTNILGLFSVGNGGYIEALEDAKSKAGADGIINCTADVHSFGVLGLFSKSTTRVKGIAVKLK